MGHIIIDIEEPVNEVSNVKELVLHEYDDNFVILKEIEAEVYQNGFLAGYVLADINLYRNEIELEGCVESGPYLTEARKFISQQYLELLNQIDKTFKRVLKVWEVIQYTVKDIHNEHIGQHLPVCQEMDQVFMIFYNIYKQLLPCVELKNMKITKDGAKDEDLISRVRKEISSLVERAFSLKYIEKESSMEVVCLSKNLTKVCQIPIAFNRAGQDVQSENIKGLELIPLVYERARDVYCARFW